MVEFGVVAGKKIGAVVAAVGRAQDRVDVVVRGLFVVEHDAGMVIELDQDDGAVDAVIEHAARLGVPIHANHVSSR